MPAPSEGGQSPESAPHKASVEEKPLLLVYDAIVSDQGIFNRALSPVNQSSSEFVQGNIEGLTAKILKHIHSTCESVGLDMNGIETRILLPHHTTLQDHSVTESGTTEDMEVFTCFVEIKDTLGRFLLLTDGVVQVFQHPVAQVAYGMTPSWGSFTTTSSETGLQLSPILSQQAFKEAMSKFDGLFGDSPNIIKEAIISEISELLGVDDGVHEVLKEKLTLGELSDDGVFHFSWEGSSGLNALLKLHAKTQNIRAYLCTEFVLRFSGI
ncbi:MAG: hypothetical protein KDD55_03750 [Bdellovibrionales bacterium]|nr:hypothetical protein [Bdellovibrionales bacterium]